MAALSAGAQDDSPLSSRSVALNAEAMDYYDAGDYQKAADLFRQSIEADSRNYLAHYNLACTLTLDAGSITEIYQALEKSVSLSSSRLARMVEDPDLAPLRTHLRYHQILGRSLEDREQRAFLLPIINWAVHPHDSTFPLSPLVFDDRGQFEITLQSFPFKGKGQWFNSQGAVILGFETGDWAGQRVLAKVEPLGLRLTPPGGAEDSSEEWVIQDLISTAVAEELGAFSR